MIEKIIDKIVVDKNVTSRHMVDKALSKNDDASIQALQGFGENRIDASTFMITEDMHDSAFYLNESESEHDVSDSGRDEHEIKERKDNFDESEEGDGYKIVNVDSDYDILYGDEDLQDVLKET
ncbi:conserved hypothetical protein [Ricinus communis]|uniref:Uncharacterized protein n=1 Tax=Ricinus communis TaxID=3988 RepID=B9SIW2_RICCO|nr:conserved hypothetical protein [Ricinus communis]